ncbi:MFS transporter [Bacillus massiliglaciei]|uniref:MFS transporter n=1 Tax=Bacillus massiliglaciei TaxID=1816693 RepID=UPI000AE82F70|nr:MFS transporter [Bacillus massiliglaciei]
MNKTNWRNPILLIMGIGISNLGAWIYLIALNVAILNVTGSAAAVAGLFIIKPLSLLITNPWAGSVIDRVNKRKLMIAIDMIRGGLILIIPFISSVWIIYLVVFLVNIAGAFFGPSSSVMITKLVSPENRKTFNSLMSMVNSGSFLIGPALSGFLILHFTTDIAIFINAVSFFVCAWFIYFLPDAEEPLAARRVPVQLVTIKKDWQKVFHFIKKANYFMVIYVLFQCAMLIGFVLDSQEVTYIKQNLNLSDQKYGLLVSVSGIGALAGAAAAAALSNKLSLRFYMGAGMLLSGIGYFCFYSASAFILASFSFLLLGFFMSFANAGYATFFQNNVPVEIMGRFGSAAEMIQGVLQIILTLLLGLMAEWFSLQAVCLIFSSVSILFSLMLSITIVYKKNSKVFAEHSAG